MFVIGFVVRAYQNKEKLILNGHNDHFHLWFVLTAACRIIQSLDAQLSVVNTWGGGGGVEPF